MKTSILSRALGGLLLLLPVAASQLASSSFDAREATIASVQHDLFSGLTTCHTIVATFLARIAALNNHTNAILALSPTALATATALDAQLAVGNATGPLFCVPILLKDNYDTAVLPTTGGNLDLARSQPSVDAPAVAALLRAGAVLLGKTNLHELALEGLSVSSLGGQTLNPYDPSRTPGGSSGGSAAAVAASFAVFATGTDTVNSLRSPASANSLFSIRPTRGLVSRQGIIPISYTQDAIGPIGRTVPDLAVALTVMAGVGYDPADNTTAGVPAAVRGLNYANTVTTGSLKGVRLGVLEGLFNRTAAPENDPVNAAVDGLLRQLQANGVILVPITDPVYNTTALAAYDVQRYEYRESMDAYLQRASLGGTHPQTLRELYASGEYLVIPSEYEYVTTSLISSTGNATYAGMQQKIRNLGIALQATFTANNLDAVAYPEQRNLVIKLGSPSQSGRNGILGAVTGSPVVTVPAGFSPAGGTAPRGVPVGMEMLGRWWTEEALLKLAYQVERTVRVRKMPVWAEEVVEVQAAGVPNVVPDRGNIPATYPTGVL